MAIAKASTTTLKSEAKLQSFIDVLIKLDQKLIKDCNAHRHDAEDAAHSLKCSSSTVGLSDSSCCPPHACSQSTTTSHTQFTSSSSSLSCPPKLMDCEQLYLETHSGCKKCCRFYLPDGHPCKFPTGEGYVKCTMASVNEARKCIKLAPLPISCDEHSSTIASVSSQPTQLMMAPPALPIMAVLGMSAYPLHQSAHPMIHQF